MTTVIQSLEKWMALASKALCRLPAHHHVSQTSKVKVGETKQLAQHQDIQGQSRAHLPSCLSRSFYH